MEIGFVLHKKVIILWEGGQDRQFVRRAVDFGVLRRFGNISMAQVWASVAMRNAPLLLVIGYWLLVIDHFSLLVRYVLYNILCYVSSKIFY